MTDTFHPEGQERQDTDLLHDILSRDNGTVLNIVQSAVEQQGSLSERFRKALAEFPPATTPTSGEEFHSESEAQVTSQVHKVNQADSW